MYEQEHTSESSNRRFIGHRNGRAEVDRSAGVGAFMGTVYAWMAAGLGVTAAVTIWFGSQPELVTSIFTSWVMWPIFIVPFLLIMFLGAAAKKANPFLGGAIYFAITGCIGVWLSSIGVLAFEDPAYASLVGQSLLITVGMFAGMSITGWITKKDLSGMGNFMMAALWGLIFAGIANVFIQSVEFDFWTSVIAVVVFAGLTAWDTQQIKQIYLSGGRGHGLAIMGALTLYLDFVNLFIHLLRILSNKD
jgi:FtsH-binding integral membrane protein